jgi:hypothetical protein
LILDEQFVTSVWNSEKKRDVLQDLLVSKWSLIPLETLYA